MTSSVESIRAEFLRYKALAEGAIAQLDDADLCAALPDHNNSIAVICWHIAGNFQSRFTDFLTTDGEKPWRHREEEFQARTVSRGELLEKWNEGWKVLLGALSDLADSDLGRSVVIRRQSLQVNEALHRSLAHVAYHVGQIVYIGRSLKGTRWAFLTIPPGQSDAYNLNPAFERPDGHARTLTDRSTI